MCSTPFVIPGHAEFSEMKIKQVSNWGRFGMSFGLAPARFLSDPLLSRDNCGNHCTTRLQVCGESVENGGVRLKDGVIKENGVLQLRLHRDKTVSMVVDGEDLGVIFRNVNTL
jgi:hypothetical protein